MDSHTIPASSDRRADLMAALLQDKAGLSIDELTERLGITRTAVRQHLAALEREGTVARGGVRPSGGRPQHVYVLTEAGAERFTRRYSWFADLLIGLLRSELGAEDLRERLEALGENAARALLRSAAGDQRLAARLGELAAAMRELGYETDPVNPREKEIVARNCIFHQLAVANPEVCAFDLGLMAKFAGAKVDHVECMARGEHVCRFRFGGK
ncbi:MAG TPA: HTH domain-containing protein [Dongiaceae bacterium]|jgi:predicted ArsR family transcriptional regulator|nr:HTH domain-containing protein [Dongiaceae bacterium]